MCLPNGLSFGQKLWANASLMMITRGDWALSASLKTRPARTGIRIVSKYLGLMVSRMTNGRSAMGASGCPSERTGATRMGRTGNAEEIAVDTTPGDAETRRSNSSKNAFCLEESAYFTVDKEM